MSGFPPLRSLGRWAAVTALRRGRAASQRDERILGRSDVVAQRRRTVEDRAEWDPLLGDYLVMFGNVFQNL